VTWNQRGRGRPDSPAIRVLTGPAITSPSNSKSAYSSLITTWGIPQVS
jgi:hypothetical protein